MEILNNAGAEYSTTEQGRCRISDSSDGSEDGAHRSKQVLCLVQQLKRKLSIFKSGQGLFLAEEEDIAKELCNYWGYRLNLGKCGVVSQGPSPLQAGEMLFGVQVRDKVKYLGT